jgi:hypothetical protein
MNPNYDACLRGIRALYQLAIEGRDESPEADTIRDATDAPWVALSESEREQLREFSDDLYRVTGAITCPKIARPRDVWIRL